MVELILGDSLEELPKLKPDFDLVIFDPPSELTEEQVVQALQLSCKASVDDAALFFYGVNPANLIWLTTVSGWHIKRLFSIMQKDKELVTDPMGFVIMAEKTSGVHLNHPLFNLKHDIVPVEGLKGMPELHSSKPLDWFEWIFHGRWDKVLDPFAGLAPVGKICKRDGIGYTGIELDEDVHSAALKYLDD